MIALILVKEAERLLADGHLSHRKIAKVLGISRATVGAIAAGTRPDYEARARQRESELEPQGPAARCSGCGGMVYTPCRLCRVRSIKSQEEDRARAFRHRARELAVKKLLAAVWRASQAREAGQGHSRVHFPAAATGGPSDCR